MLSSATAGSIVGALKKESGTVPIVFVTTIDPVGGGWIESLARPGTNATGFAAYEFSIGGKWLGLLKEVAPGVKQVAVIRDPSVPAGSGGFAAIQTAATSSGVELTPIGVRDATEIERGILGFATRTGPDGGLIMVGPGSSVRPHRDLIIALVARHRLPAIYPTRDFNRGGAGGTLGTAVAAKAAPDGYTLVLVPTSHVINPSIYAKLPYDTEKDFAPVTMVASAAILMAVNPSVPADLVRAFVEAAKAKPQAIANYGSAGAGTVFHLTGELFKQLSGLPLQHMPYRS